MFDTLTDNITKTFRRLNPHKPLTNSELDSIGRDIKVALLEADVNLAATKEFVAGVKQAYRESEPSEALTADQHFIKIVNDQLVQLLGGSTRELPLATEGPTVIMLAGLQGVGKTTFAGKLALWLKEQGRKPLLVAADLHRPNAVSQLTVNAGKVGVEIFAPEPGNGVGDPVAVASQARAHALERGLDTIILDTAGRLAVDSSMMLEARNIQEAIRPTETIFVLDGMIGQSAADTARSFQEALSYDSVALTKLDGDSRGGAALSIVSVAQRPISFVSTGEGMGDFERFHPERIASRILAMGDVLTLIEQAEKQFDLQETAKAAGKLQAGTFTLEDFLSQLNQVRKLGNMTKLMGMVPGMASMREQMASVSEKDIDRQTAIILSMTPQERRDQALIDHSRVHRIAAGAGVSLEEVESLLERFKLAQAAMEQMMKGGGVPKLGELAGAVGGEPRKARQPRVARKKGKGARRSGNPAKR